MVIPFRFSGGNFELSATMACVQHWRHNSCATDHKKLFFVCFLEKMASLANNKFFPGKVACSPSAST